MIYSGIGARDTPPNVLFLMGVVASKLSARGYHLRSGGARGADQAFANGAECKDIYLPYDGFCGHVCLNNPNYYDCQDFPNYDEAIQIVRDVHPSGKYLKGFPLQAHARNCYILLGASLSTPSKFVVCWTADGCEDGDLATKETGGTGMGIKIAKMFDIPVINMHNDDWKQRIGDLV